MKRLMFILSAMLIALSVNAQKIVKGEIPSLKGEKKINLQVDYSEMKINNMSLTDWVSYRQAEQPDFDAQKELETELKPSIKERLSYRLSTKLEKAKAFLTLDNSANYTVVVKPINVEKKGNNTNECAIKDKDGNTLVVFTAEGKGGTFGSMSNLFGDGYRSSGTQIGDFLLKCFKK